MVNIYGPTGLLVSGATAASASVSTERASVVLVYVDYTRGSEDGIRLSFEARSDLVGASFPIQREVGGQIKNYEPTITDSGKLRIPIPVGESEDDLIVGVSFDGSVASPGSAHVWVVPDVRQL